MTKKADLKIRVSKTASGRIRLELTPGSGISTTELGPPTNLRPAGAHKDRRRKTRAVALQEELDAE